MDHKRVIFICGLSGVGKSYLVDKFIQRHPDFVQVDLDSFYKREKPTVKLSNGETVSNWDDPEAIDWDKFNQHVLERLSIEGVIISGFAPLKDRIKFKVDLFVELSFGLDCKDSEILEKCLESRRKSKKFQTDGQIKKDELMVREVTFPIYQATMKKYPADLVIPVFRRDNDGDRVNIEEILSQIQKEEED